MSSPKGFSSGNLTQTTEYIATPAGIAKIGISYVRGSTALAPGQCLVPDSSNKYKQAYTAGNAVTSGEYCGVLDDYEPDGAASGEIIIASMLISGTVYKNKLTGYHDNFKNAVPQIRFL
jgi:hypothetical protein